MASLDLDLLRKRNDPAYLNWLAVGDALRILCDGLRQYAEKEMKAFHSWMISKVVGSKCNCLCTPETNPHKYIKTSCTWAKQLGKFHCMKKKSRIPWHQSDSSRWHDPTSGYWEIAKIYMSDLGNDCSRVKDPSSTDSTGLLNLLYSCTYFKVQQTLVKSVRDWRNKWAHAPDQLLSDLDKQAAFDEIVNLLNDAQLMSCQEVQNCQTAIENVRIADFSILPKNELSIWKEVNKCEFNNEERKKWKQIEKSLKAIIRSEMASAAGNNPQSLMTCNFIVVLISTLLGVFFSSFKNGSKHFWWIFFMLNVLQVGDKSMLYTDSGMETSTYIKML